jgi:hypothetical protein
MYPLVQRVESFDLGNFTLPSTVRASVTIAPKYSVTHDNHSDSTGESQRSFRKMKGNTPI